MSDTINVWSVWWASAGDEPDITLFTSEQEARDYYERNKCMDFCELDVYCLPLENPKRSKWVKMKGMMPPEFAGRYACERCGWRDHPHNKPAKHPYCPGCGAYMENNDGLVGG